MVKLYNIKGRGVKVDVSHLELKDVETQEKIKECIFLNLDTPYARMEYKGNLFLLYSNTEVKLIEG